MLNRIHGRIVVARESVTTGDSKLPLTNISSCSWKVEPTSTIARAQCIIFYLFFTLGRRHDNQISVFIQMKVISNMDLRDLSC